MFFSIQYIIVQIIIAYFLMTIWVEGKFGQGKNDYNMNKIRLLLAYPCKSRAAGIVFVMNIL